MPPREIIERLVCDRNATHVEVNETLLASALQRFIEAGHGGKGHDWTPEDTAAWQTWKRVHGYSSSIVFDEHGMGCCGVCGHPMLRVTTIDGAEGRRRRVTEKPEDAYIPPTAGRWCYELEKCVRLYIISVTPAGQVQMAYRPGDPIAVTAEPLDFNVFFEVIA